MDRYLEVTFHPRCHQRSGCWIVCFWRKLQLLTRASRCCIYFIPFRGARAQETIPRCYTIAIRFSLLFYLSCFDPSCRETKTNNSCFGSNTRCLTITRISELRKVRAGHERVINEHRKGLAGTTAELSCFTASLFSFTKADCGFSGLPSFVAI